MDCNRFFNRVEYNFKKDVARTGLMITLIVLFSICLTYSAEFPEPVEKHYQGKQSIYWEIQQISISPIFDEPETSLVKFYFQKPQKMFITMPDKQVYVNGDTIWTYLINHKQIQKSISEHFFNPFDFIDSNQTYYRVIADKDGMMTLMSIDESMEPDRLEVNYSENGAITRVEYQDINDNKVIFEFSEESFSVTIPDDNFLNDIPDEVEVIDLND
jgi:outer membrane lipoprotein-sorting protein